MVTKLDAARTVTAAGEAMVLCGGHDPRIVLDVLEGRDVGTLFLPAGDRLGARKRWLAFSARPQGLIRVDAGAREALVKRNKSLLPSGIVAVEGRFQGGALVELSGPDGAPFARGLSNYTHEEIAKIRGLKTARVAQVLGQMLFEEVVHRDNLVVL
ncbi:MAG: hypothetical protein M5U26_18950 [Planctomycetota bacterium]|nr:hypothetical protein [Planctomycetota bacterium]